jgi:hypothetical protein
MKGEAVSTRRVKALAIVVFIAFHPAPASADRADRVIRTLGSDPSWRVRLQAVVVLGKLGDPQAIPALERALGDENQTVRGLAAKVLGDLAEVGDPQVIAALESAQRDGSGFVRERVAVALERLHKVARAADGKLLHVEVGGIGVKARNAPPELSHRLREFIIRELQRTPGLTIEGKPISGFLIDSAITALTRKTTPEYVEVSCEISFIVGRLPSKAMVMMTSGGATVQAPRMGFRPESERALQVDALENAVQGAHQNLLAYLKAQR